MTKRSEIVPRRSLLGQARSAWPLAVWLLFCSWLPAVGAAHELARTHDREVQEMVAASVKVETGFNGIFADFSRRKRLTSDASSPDLRAEGRLNQECYNFVHARFYAKYRTLLDSIDISGLSGFSNLRRNRTDKSVLSDPKKIAYQTNYIISSFKFLKDFHPPLEKFVVQYSTRSDLEEKCAYYLEVTGTRN